MKNRFLTRSICILFLLSVLASAFFVAAYANVKTSSSYSSELSHGVYIDEILETYVDGIALTDAEKDYLRLSGGLLLTYSLNIPTSQVKAEYSDGTLTVTANEYVDPYSENKSLVWIPTEATVNGTTKAFTDSPYTVQFFGLDAQNGDSVDVKYTADFSISKDTVNGFINLAYNDAVRYDAEIREKTAEYEKAYAEYALKSAAYEKYLADTEAYNLYLTQKRIYEEKSREYLVYLEELREYEDAKAKYDAYLAAKEQYYKDFADYMKFLSDLKLYNKKVAEHKQYEKKIAVVRNQLGVINATKTPITSLKRTVYSAIMGDTVTTVIENKGNIVEVFGANPEVVDMAGVATNNLRELLKDYFEISGNNEEERYKYYVTNYELFRDNFANLLVALDNLYLNEGVRGAMIAQEKHEKYLILVAQLYYVANALSDEPILSYSGKYYFDSDYKIGMSYPSDKRVSLSKALENESFLSDTNDASPVEGGYPIEPIIPTYTPVDEPIVPTPVTCPIELEPVSEPVEPAPVQQPEEVMHPGAAPKPYTAEESVVKLVRALNCSELELRADYSGSDVNLHFEIDVSKVYLGAKEVTVTYYDKEFENGAPKNVLYTVTVDKNSYADYGGPVPTKPETAEYAYLHCGWVDENGNVPNLVCVTADLKLYPKFEAVKKTYLDAWIVDGVKFDYDPGIPAMKTDGEFYYDFSGWKTEVDYDRLTKTHTAVFDKPFVPTSDGAAKISYQNHLFVVEPPVYQDKLDLGNLITRAAGLGGISLRYPDGQELTVSYSDVILLKEESVSSISLVSAGEGQAFTYSVVLYDGEGNKVQSSAKIGCKVYCSVTDLPHFLLYSFDDNGERKMLRFGYDNGILSFTALPCVDYHANIEYSLSAIPIDSVVIMPEKNSALAGESVKLTLNPAPGISVDRVYYIDSSGAKITIPGESFIMPWDDIVIGVDYTVEQYTVSFVSDGKTIVEYFCNYGDTVSPPTNPKKASDEKYSYEFVGWSPEIVPVTANTVYTAVYTSTELPKSFVGNDEITEGVLKLLLLFGVGTSCFLLIVIPSVTMTFVLVKRRKKHLNK